ncbi:MAG: T9SS type A sorting domain-containing protein [Bacteroidota bacterium]
MKLFCLPGKATHLFLCFLALILLQTQAHTQTIDSTCTLTAFGPGSNQHAFWFRNLPGASTRRWDFDANGGQITYYSDSSAHIEGRIYLKSDTTRQWDVDMWLINKKNFADWSAQGGDVKVGNAPQSVVQANQQDYCFYELDSTRASMYGVPGSFYDGDTINLTHRPASFEFGFQMGLGANAQTGDFGLSGWFDYTGSYTGDGDINVNLQCGQTQTCAVTVDTVYTECITDSTFTLWVGFSGVGNNFQITDDWNTAPLGNLSPGLYQYGVYLNSTEVYITVSDPAYTDCTDPYDPVTADCTPIPVCDIALDTLYTQCQTDSTFEIVVSFTGSGSQFQIFDDQFSPLQFGLPAGTYTYGSYPNGTKVVLTVSDFAIFNCQIISDTLTDSCSTSGMRMGRLYPNPVQDQMWVEVRVDEDVIQQPVSCLVVDGMGRTRLSDQSMLGPGTHRLQIDCTPLKNGLYFLQLKADDQIIRTKRILIWR